MNILKALFAGALLFYFSSIAYADNTKEEKLKKIIDFFLSENANDYYVKIVKYPIETQGDISGLEKFQTKSNEISEILFHEIVDPSQGNTGLLRSVFETYDPQDIQKLAADGFRDRHRMNSPKTGDTIGFRHHISTIYLMAYPINLVEILSEYPSEPKAIWDGVAGRFEIAEDKVVIGNYLLASHLSSSPRVAAEVLLSQPEEIQAKFRRNYHTADPKTRTEPFDLLQNQLLQSIEGKSNNRLVATSIIHKSLYKLFKMTPELDPRAEGLPSLNFVNHGRDGYVLYGTCQYLSLGRHTGQSNLFSTIAVSNDILEEYSSQKVPITCDKEKAYLDIKLRAGSPLSLPQPFELARATDDGAFDVLATYNLTTETDQQLVRAASLYLLSQGYVRTKYMENVNTREFFDAEFPKTDMLVSASHVIDVNELGIGSKKSRYMVFEKSFKTPSDGRKRVKVKALFPMGKDFGEIVERDELAELFRLRRRHGAQSLLSLTVSCQSASAVITWSNAFRDGVIKDVAAGILGDSTEATDLVTAISSNGGFPTASPAELLLDFKPALITIEKIMGGVPFSGITKVLEEKIEPDWFIRRVYGFMNRKKDPENRRKLEGLNFQPVYNLEIPWLLNSSGFDVRLVIEE